MAPAGHGAHLRCSAVFWRWLGQAGADTDFRAAARGGWGCHADHAIISFMPAKVVNTQLLCVVCLRRTQETAAAVVVAGDSLCSSHFEVVVDSGPPGRVYL